MRLNATTGWLTDVKHVPSPNYNTRPEGCQIELLVIHCISLPPGAFGGPYIDRLFTNAINETDPPEVQAHAFAPVSAHALITRDGCITQYVSFNDRAWHAGHSRFQTMENCNDFSIGIELEGTIDVPYAMVQYDQLAQLTTMLRQCYPAITMDHIVGHEHIAPGRKTDPGPSFDWTHYKHLVKQREDSTP